MSNKLIEELLDNANIVDVIGQFIKLHKSGANYFGLCPFHPDNHASLSVSPKKRIFKCFSCGTSGNVINFVQKYKKISYGQAIKEVAKLLGYSDQQIDDYFFKSNKSLLINSKLYSLNAEANEIFKSLLFNTENKKYLQYLLDRKLSLSTIKKFEVGFCGKNNSSQIMYDLLTNKEINSNAKWNENDLLEASLININDKSLIVNDYFYNRITFPIKDKNGFIIAFIARDILANSELKYLSSKETKLFSKSNTLYNLDRILSNKPETLIILEGNIDLLSLYEANFDENKYGPIALMGVAFTSNHINLLKSAKFIKNILLWLDNDQAGWQSTLTNGLRLLQAGFNNVYIIVNDTKYKDVNEILVNCGKQEVLDMLHNDNKIDFLSFYIEKQLTNVSQINLIRITHDILQLVKSYGNQLLWNKYCQLIAAKTSLNLDDITLTFKKIVPHISLQNNQTDQNHKIVHPLIKKLDQLFDNLLFCLIYNPSNAQYAYESLQYKHMNISLSYDYIYVIKNYAVTDFDPHNIIDGQTRLLEQIFANKKISEKTFLKIKEMLIDHHIYKARNLIISSSKSKCLTIVENINDCYRNILLLQYKNQLNNKNISDDQKNKIKTKIKSLNIEINIFKRKRKTKYHF